MGAAISVVTSNDAVEVANAIFNGPGVSVVGATLETSYFEEAITGDRGSAGTFTRGPFGIGSGALVQGTESRMWKDLDIVVDTGYNGLSVEFVIGTDEDLQGNADPVGIYLNNVQYALDTSGNRITVNSEYLQQPIGIKENGPFTSTTYAHSSPPLLMGLPVAPGQHQMIFAVCDLNNGQKDSALMVKAGACVDCVHDIELNYVTTTTTVGPTPFVSTIKPSITMSGTVVYGVPEDATTTLGEITTTSEEVFSTSTADVTSYSEEPTSTTDVISTSEVSTATETATTADTLSTSTEASTTIEEPTTTEEATTTEKPTTTQEPTSTEESTFTEASTTTKEHTTTDSSTSTEASGHDPTKTGDSSTATDYTTTTIVTSGQGSETSSAVESDTTTAIVTTGAATTSTDISASPVSTSMGTNVSSDIPLTTLAATTSHSQETISTASTFTTRRRPCRP
ncbi:hypothetical protein FPOA_09101 [Fusarium poae]|uniref:Uncharacterized protein n=1 Tax=Fusarium poae TaxID=36050 RepID=A0A1B8AQH5_FUSPO|nr:hypothetical protein FPOA_09101 [Fusarium poae]